MTAQTTKIGFLGYDEEGAFAEALSTYDKTLQVRDANLIPDGLGHVMIPRGGVYGRPNEQDNMIMGPHTGSTFTFTMDLYGHGAATNGALSQQPLARLLGHAFGGADASVVGGSCTGDSTGSDDIVSANVTLARGQFIRVGALGDTRGNGQANVSDDGNDATPFDLVAEFDDDPDSADVVYGMQTIYPLSDISSSHLTSDSSTSNNTLRFIVATGNQIWALRGCALSGATIQGLGTGEIPSITLTWHVAFFDDIDVAFPSGTASADHAPAPVANGSFFIQAVGTSTRNLEVIRNFSMSIEHEMTPLMGPGGTNQDQVIVGYVRGASKPTVNFDVMAPDATASPTYSNFWQTDPNSIVNKHILYTLSVVDGRALAIYLPEAIPVGPRPTQADVDGLGYVNLSFQGVVGPTTDNELLVAPWRMGLG